MWPRACGVRERMASAFFDGLALQLADADDAFAAKAAVTVQYAVLDLASESGGGKWIVDLRSNPVVVRCVLEYTVTKLPQALVAILTRILC